MKLDKQRVAECAVHCIVGLFFAVIIIFFFGAIVWTLFQPSWWWFGSHVIALFLGVLLSNHGDA